MRINVRGRKDVPSIQPELGKTEGRASFRGSRLMVAFTLLEVMIAMGIFFMCIFAILGLVSSNLRLARKLQDSPVDANMLISELSLTNKLQEGSDSGDFGELYPGYKWESQLTEVGTNGLFQVEYMVTAPTIRGQNPVQTHLTALLWRPNSVAGLSSSLGFQK
jgi:hypothetical protein